MQSELKARLSTPYGLTLTRENRMHLLRSFGELERDYSVKKPDRTLVERHGVGIRYSKDQGRRVYTRGIFCALADVIDSTPSASLDTQTLDLASEFRSSVLLE